MNFLKQARQTALGRFDPTKLPLHGCATIQCAVPGKAEAGGFTGTIVLHVSPPVLEAWTKVAQGTVAERRSSVMGQLRLVLKDLSDHDLQACLALSQAQSDVYEQDLSQLVAESLERTTFTELRRHANIHWEGTLVRSMDPPFCIVVASIDFAQAAPARVAW